MLQCSENYYCGRYKTIPPPLPDVIRLTDSAPMDSHMFTWHTTLDTCSRNAAGDVTILADRAHQTTFLSLGRWLAPLSRLRLVPVARVGETKRLRPNATPSVVSIAAGQT
jgi:hypothetical protein